jgi:hypothetical protein
MQQTAQLLPKASRIRDGMKMLEMFFKAFSDPSKKTFLGTFESYTALYSIQLTYLIGDVSKVSLQHINNFYLKG